MKQGCSEAQKRYASPWAVDTHPFMASPVLAPQSHGRECWWVLKAGSQGRYMKCRSPDLPSIFWERERGSECACPWRIMASVQVWSG